MSIDYFLQIFTLQTAIELLKKTVQVIQNDTILLSFQIAFPPVLGFLAVHLFSSLLKSCPQFIGQLFLIPQRTGLQPDQYQGADSAIQPYYLPFASVYQGKDPRLRQKSKVPMF